MKGGSGLGGAVLKSGVIEGNKGNDEGGAEVMDAIPFVGLAPLNGAIELGPVDEGGGAAAPAWTPTRAERMKIRRNI